MDCSQQAPDVRRTRISFDKPTDPPSARRRRIGEWLLVHLPKRDRLLTSQQGALDLLDGTRDLDPAWARFSAVENGATAPDTGPAIENLKPFGGALITAVVDESVSIHNCRRPNKLFVGPGDWARRGAGSA